jgi:hypothetical protein
MKEKETKESLSPKHHALLFAWISREVIRRVGEERGEAVIHKAVRKYGEQRGRRMALRVQADGQELSMLNFLTHAEWEGNKEDHIQKTLETAPHFHAQVSKCLWHDTWMENDLLPYGRLYCLEVDQALVSGFNPALILEVNATLSNDHRDCDFVFHNANLTPENLQIMEERRQAVRDTAVMPWDYHLGHLYKTIGEVLLEELGEVGQEAVKAAMQEFAGRFGEEAARIIEGYREEDFNQLLT